MMQQIANFIVDHDPMMVIRRMAHRFQTEEIKRISFIKRRVGNKDEITRCRWRRFHDDGITFLRLLDAGLTIPSGKTIVHPLARQRRGLVKIQFLR